VHFRRRQPIKDLERDPRRPCPPGGVARETHHNRVTGGMPLQVTGKTNFIRVERIP